MSAVHREGAGAPRVASVTLMRNECDIAELFIKINARFLSHMRIVDHHSNDATARIVQSLQAQGYPVSYQAWPELTFQQSRTITALCRELAASGCCDYVLPLDADEFIDEAQWPAWAALADVPSDAHATVGIRNYCATADRYHEVDAPLFHLFRPRAHEPWHIPRVVLGRVFAQAAEVTEGNHVALHPHLSTTPVPLDVQLQHVPFRSSAQVIAKTIPAASALRTKPNRMPGEGAHWEVIARYIRDRDFQLKPNELAAMALFYPANRAANEGNRILTDAPGIGRASDVITMKDEARVDVLRSFCGAIDLLEQRLLASGERAPS